MDAKSDCAKSRHNGQLYTVNIFVNWEIGMMLIPANENIWLKRKTTYIIHTPFLFLVSEEVYCVKIMLRTLFAYFSIPIQSIYLAVATLLQSIEWYNFDLQDKYSSCFQHHIWSFSCHIWGLAHERYPWFLEYRTLFIIPYILEIFMKFKCLFAQSNFGFVNHKPILRGLFPPIRLAQGDCMPFRHHFIYLAVRYKQQIIFIIIYKYRFYFSSEYAIL